MTNTPVINFPYLPPLPMTNVTPFTYRDGLTYLQTLNELRDTIIRVVNGQVELDDKINAALANINGLIEQLETLTTDILTAIQETGDQYLPRMEDLYSLHTQLANQLSPLFEIEQNLANEIQNRETAIQNEANARTAAINAERDARSDADSALLETLGDLSDDHSATRDRVDVLESMKPHHYGAIGDGVTDDTAALKNFLADGNRIFDGKTYRITDTLSFNGNNIELEGNGTTLIPDGTTLHDSAIYVAGDYASVHGFSIRSVHADMNEFLAAGGKGEVRQGISVDGMYAKINDNTVTNLFSYNNVAGIRVNGRGGSIVSGNIVSDIEAIGSEQGNDGTAYARGISIQCDTGAAVRASTVVGNTIERITGQGSAGINTLHSDQSTRPFPNGHVNIIGNAINDIDRRHIKVQSSNVTISGNVIRDTRTNTPVAAASVIDCIDSQRIVITNNTVERTDLNNVIMVHQELSPNPPGFIRITNNTIESQGNKSVIGIYVGTCNQVYITGNTIVGGKDGIRVGTVESGVISYNSTGYQTSDGASVLTTASCKSLMVSYNSDTSPYRDGNPFPINGDFVQSVGNVSRA